MVNGLGLQKEEELFFFFLKKDGGGTFDEGRILQAEELTANRWKAGVRKEAQTPLDWSVVEGGGGER
jgi:hypothetical protein